MTQQGVYFLDGRLARRRVHADASLGLKRVGSALHHYRRDVGSLLLIKGAPARGKHERTNAKAARWQLPVNQPPAEVNDEALSVTATRLVSIKCATKFLHENRLFISQQAINGSPVCIL